MKNLNDFLKVASLGVAAGLLAGVILVLVNLSGDEDQLQEQTSLMQQQIDALILNVLERDVVEAHPELFAGYVAREYDWLMDGYERSLGTTHEVGFGNVGDRAIPDLELLIEWAQLGYVGAEEVEVRFERAERYFESLSLPSEAWVERTQPRIAQAVANLDQ